MSNISPGVYTKIIDLSTYVQAVPSTTGFICALTKKGRDNQALFLGGRSELVSEWGEPNITTYGKNYGQGQYCAYNFLGESGSLYYMRPMPDDATYSNLRIDVVKGATDSTADIQITWVESMNEQADIKTALEYDGSNPDVYPLCILYPIGRGDYYNSISVRLTKHANPMFEGIYIFDVYETQSDGDEVIIESYTVSFDPNARDNSGDSIFITDILEKYSGVLRADMMRLNGDYTDGYEMLVRAFDNDMGYSTVTTVEELAPAGSGNYAFVDATLTDVKQDFSDWQNVSEAGEAEYSVLVIDGRGNRIWGWIGMSFGDDNESIRVFNNRNLDTASLGWICELGSDTETDEQRLAHFDWESPVTYFVRKELDYVSDGFISATPIPLRKGSDGSLIKANGKLDFAVAEQLLAQAYAGIIDGNILDTEKIYFTMVFDCGYPSSVKSEISNLVQTRRDCVALLDNGDNPDFDHAIAKRESDHSFNNYFCALYESYNKIYDSFTGSDIWVSPIYHMSYLAPRNDNVAEVWYAIAGFQRGSIDGISELRFNPRLGQRDQMYLKQLNPIVKFAVGYSVWGQLTTQAKPSALQDLNIVRLVLYCKRALEQYAKFYIFELNDEITWNSVRNEVVDFLESVKAKRGLYAYSVEVGATEYEKKTKTFHINVSLTPTRVTEKIELNFFIY